MTTIVVGNDQQFLDWCHDNNIRPPFPGVRHVTEYIQLLGLHSTIKHRVVLLDSAFPCAGIEMRRRGFEV